MVMKKNIDADQPAKSANQLCREKKKGKDSSQTEIIEQQRKEIEDLKVASTQLHPKNLMEAMMQAMACMYMTNKVPTEKNVGTESPGESLISVRKNHQN